MTVADGHREAPADIREGFSTELADLLATAGGSRPLIALSRSIEPVDAIALFAAARARDFEAALWLQPAAGRAIVGVGRAWAFEGGGADRFAAATTAWRAVLADAVVGGRASARPVRTPAPFRVASFDR